MSANVDFMSDKEIQRVTLGTRKSPGELIEAVDMASIPHGLNREIKALFKNELVKVSDVVSHCDVLIVSNRELGITHGSSFRSVSRRMRSRGLRLLNLEEVIEWFLVDDIIGPGVGVLVATVPLRLPSNRKRKFHLKTGVIGKSAKRFLGIRFIESHLQYRTTTLWACARM